MDVKQLRKEYSKRKPEIRQRLKEFEEAGRQDTFYELCFCLLTPQSSARKCWKAVTELKKNDFRKQHFPAEIILKNAGVRFHNTKSKRLYDIRICSNSLLSELSKIKDSREKREFLVRNVKGLGYKEASHFLRNTGHKSLAILDRHILRNLARMGVIESVPKTMTPKKYLEIEKKLRKFSKKAGIGMDELDLLFWSMETGEVFK